MFHFDGALKSKAPLTRDLRFYVLPLLDEFRTTNWYKFQQELKFSGILEEFSLELS